MIMTGAKENRSTDYDMHPSGTWSRGSTTFSKTIFTNNGHTTYVVRLRYRVEVKREDAVIHLPKHRRSPFVQSSITCYLSKIDSKTSLRGRTSPLAEETLLLNKYSVSLFVDIWRLLVAFYLQERAASPKKDASKWLLSSLVIAPPT